MKTKLLFLVVLISLAALTGRAATRYVNVNNLTPEFPYDQFSKAATVIQDAVEAAVVGDLILVTNGVYSTGGRTVGTNLLANRVAVDKPLTLRSFNGPEVTVIQGYQVPVYTNWAGAVRCVYLASGAVLSGFTLTNGATRASGVYVDDGCGGGVHCESGSAVVTNCTVTGNAAYYCAGAYRGTLNNCTLTKNAAYERCGGAYRGTLNNCILAGNCAGYGVGGGAYDATLNDCLLTNNVARDGGGAYECLLNHCLLKANAASLNGGGAYQSTNDNCSLTENSSREYGGGAYAGTLNNCVVTGNSARYYGGGAMGSTLNNCTVTDNLAREGSGGGVHNSALKNCIVYYNRAAAEPNYSYYTVTFTNCCTTPMPWGGEGNITNEPALASTSHLSSVSPCRGAGSAAYAGGTDIDGEAWRNPPSIGCDEYRTGAVTGPLSVEIHTDWTNVLTGYSLSLRALIAGRVSASVWDFGDGMVVSNQPFASHAWAAAGDYLVVLWAYNENNPGGISATVAVKVVTEAVHYVRLDSPAPSPPYSTWATAARVIQDAVDAAWVPRALVLVSNGVYQTGGRIIDYTTNRVAVTKLLTLQSLNGPEVTIIEGYQEPGTTNGETAVRGVYLGDGAVLSGFTLTNGATRWSSGGGAFCESTSVVLTNCILTGNVASWPGGGGAYRGTLYACTLAGNMSHTDGGGTYNANLYNCTLTGNSAQNDGGGATWSGAGTLNNCTLTGNSAGEAGGGAYFGTLTDCTLTGNSARGGGGACAATLQNCTLTDNSATQNGGGAIGWLYDCTLSGNSAPSGGGAYSGELTRCLVTGNSATSGGGAHSAMLTRCVVTGNSALQSGGGALGGMLDNCLVTGNSAGTGGGVYQARLNNCTLTGNSANSGGGAFESLVENCIVYYNSAVVEGANLLGGNLDHCCTTPMPAGGYCGKANITNAPGFVDLAGDNLRLQTNSPCINGGRGDTDYGLADLDGNPRLKGSFVDMGAYEFQSPTSVLPYAWLQQYGLPTDGSADYAHSDSDGHNNWQEWCCQTDPTNALSALRLLSATPVGTNVLVSWQSVAGVLYYLLRSTNLCAQPAFELLETLIEGETGTAVYEDLDAARLAPVYYRVGVGEYMPPPPMLSCRFDASARTLELSWSSTGFHLQVQTSSAGVGLTTDWVDYPSGDQSPVTVPVEAGVGAVFFRLAWWP